MACINHINHGSILRNNWHYRHGEPLYNAMLKESGGERHMQVNVCGRSVIKMAGSSMIHGRINLITLALLFSCYSYSSMVKTIYISTKRWHGMLC